MQVVTPPLIWAHHPRPWLFLAGSIDNGAADDWQARAIRALDGQAGTVLNPRRASWNPRAGDDEIRAQASWELKAIQACDLVMMFFAPSTLAPITLLELGLCAGHRPLIVACSNAYWRRANVRLVCEVAEVPMFDTLDALVAEAKRRLTPR